MYEIEKVKRILILFGALCLILIAAGIINVLNNAGKIQVTIEAFPSDATVLMDGQKVKSGQYVTPGDHTFVAKKEGFADRTSRVFIGEEVHRIVLPLVAVSEEAQAWLSVPENRARYEELGTELADQEGASARIVNPLINVLPRTSVAGPYTINFGFPDPNDEFKMFYSVDDSSPVGRRKAIEWLKTQNVNPVTLDLQFGNYINPLTKEIY